MKWKVACLAVGASAFSDGDPTIEFNIKEKINAARVQMANIRPLDRINEELRASARKIAQKAAKTCAVAEVDFGCGDEHLQNIAGYDRVGEAHWVCKGADCESKPDDQPVVDWLAEGDCYSYGPCGQGDKLESCGDDAVIADFRQIMWDTEVTEAGFEYSASPREIGCAKVACESEAGVVVVCHFGPSGNSPGSVPFASNSLDHLSKVYPAMSGAAPSITTKADDEAVETDISKAIKSRINLLRKEWAGLQPIVKVDSDLVSMARAAAVRSAASCSAQQGFPGEATTHFNRVGETQWACKGMDCQHMPLDQAALDWANQGGCYQYGTFGDNDVLPQCDGAYVHDFVQLFWDTMISETKDILAAAPTHIGCAIEKCTNEDGMVVVCRYGPGGNFPGHVPFNSCPLVQLSSRFPNMGSEAGSTTTTTTAPMVVEDVDREWLTDVVESLNGRRSDWAGLAPLKLNEDLVLFAQRRATENAILCTKEKTSDERRADVAGFGRVGESLWGCHGSCTMPSGIIPSDWAKQGECWTYTPYGSPNSNLQDALCQHKSVFDDFTQMFWDTPVDDVHGRATDIGCGKAFCANDGNGGTSYQVVCTYGPEGNVAGVYPFDETVAAHMAETQYPRMYPPQV